MANTTDLKRVDTALYVEPDELQAGVHALGHDDRDHVVDPEQGDQHQSGPCQLPGTHTEGGQLHTQNYGGTVTT